MPHNNTNVDTANIARAFPQAVRISNNAIGNAKSNRDSNSFLASHLSRSNVAQVAKTSEDRSPDRTLGEFGYENLSLSGIAFANDIPRWASAYVA